MKNTIYLLFIILLFSFLKIEAQYSLQGQILDKKSKQPIADVSIKVTGIELGAISDFEGHYKLDVGDLKDIHLQFSSVGYKSQSLHIVFTSKVKIVNVYLEEDVFEIDEVILSTPFNKLQKDNVVKVSHKSIASLQKSGMLNLMDGVVQMSGVNKMSTGTGISKPVIRGLSGSRVLVYNQGLRVENFQFGDFHGLGINESGIEGVEVLKGPASLLYGSDAVGGVLYLIPEKYAPINSNITHVKYQFNSNNLGHNTSLAYKISGDKLKFLARASYKINTNYQIPNGKRVTNSGYNNLDFKAGIGYKTEKTTTDVRVNQSQSQNAIPHQIDAQSTSYSINGKYQDLKNTVLSVKNTWRLNRSKIKTNLGYTLHNRKLIANNMTKIGMQLNTLNYDVKWYLPHWKKTESILGIQGIHQTNSNFGTNILLPNALSNGIGVFSTINHSTAHSVFQAGLRYDTKFISVEDTDAFGRPNYRAGFDKNLHSFTGSLGFKTSLAEKTDFRLNLSSGFRAPNLSELTSHGVHSGRVEIGDQSLDNEQSIQADLSLEYANTHLEFFMNSFVNRINHYIYLEPTGETQDGYYIYRYKQKDAQLFGGEIGIHLHPHPYDWLHIDSSFETVTGQLRESDAYLPLIPSDKWKNKFQIRLPHLSKSIEKSYLNMGINHSFKAEHVNPAEDKHQAYTLFNLGYNSKISVKNTSLQINLSVHNLFNKTYISHLSILRDYQIPNMGRDFLVSLKLNL